MKDPREQIQTENLSAEQYCGEEGYGPARWSVDGGCLVDWPEVVELAQKILAANEAWLDGQTPTLDDLMAQYPAWKMRIESSSSHGLVRVWAERQCAPGHPIGRDGFGTFPSAIRWLAAKLEELTDGK